MNHHKHQKKPVEHFDDLEWGYYPISEEYNSGGCQGCSLADIDVTPEQQLRIDIRDNNSLQRGGNNPMEFMEKPAYTQYEVGTGCYNPNCHCQDCQGDCMCNLPGGSMLSSLASKGVWYWLFILALVWLVYKMFIKRQSRR